jgi:uncharacterized protein (TIGR02594 family)
MYLNARVLLAVGCISLLAMSTPALSIPAPRGPEHQQRNVHKKKIAQRTPASHAKPHAVRETQAAHLVGTPIVLPPKRPMSGWPALVREARKYIGTNPTARTTLWCATFMNLVLARLGYSGTNSDAAMSFTDYGHRISEPKIGAIAVLSRGRRGGHVGVVSGIDSHGNPIIISGNHGHRVGEGIYPRARVIAYVMPTERRPVGETHVAKPIAVSRPSSPVARSAPSRARPEPVIDSPISELVAAIEAEQSRPRAHARPARLPRPPVPHHTVRRMAERTQQFARQVARPPGPHAMPPARRELRRDLPRHRVIAGMFGIKARASVTPPRLALRHQQPVQQPGRFASAYVGLAAR